MSKPISRSRITISLAMFGVGLIVVIVGLQFPAIRHLFATIESSGYPGAFLANLFGVLTIA